MFKHPPFYHGIVRKMTALMGTLFNDIYIFKGKNEDNSKLVKVPITYGPADIMLARVKQDPDADRETALPFPSPMISFEFIDAKYDSSRKLSSVNMLTSQQPDGSFNRSYMPVPYDFDFRVYVWSKDIEDGLKIVEQILPFFTPEFTVNAVLVPELGELAVSIPIVLNNVTHHDNYRGELSERRYVIWTFDFTMKGYFFGPVIKNAPVIRLANVNVFYAMGQIDHSCGADNADVKDMSELNGWVSVRPGLTPDGKPTSIESESIDYMEINADDDYGYILAKGYINQP